MLYMAIERFKNRDAQAVIAASARRGAWLRTVSTTWSRVETSFDRCFQLMECADLRLLEQWADRWRDLVDFEFVAVRLSKEATGLISVEV